jgi:hypothetical protein
LYFATVLLFTLLFIWLKVDYNTKLAQKEMKDFQNYTTFNTLSVILLLDDQENNLKETLIDSIISSLEFMEKDPHYNMEFYCEFWSDELLKKNLIHASDQNFSKVVNKLNSICDSSPK